MKTTIEFLDAVKAKHGIKSNYALAKLMEQTDTAVARWMHGKNTFSDETAMQVADLLEIDPAYVVACIHAERAKHDKERKMWERIATMATGLAAALFVIAILPSAPLPNGDFNVAFLGVTSPSMYIMSNGGIQSFALYSALCLLATAAIMKRLTQKGAS